jgi:3'-phosphoadenosine 5'-phosphosulfate sulfotransferase (PAPS reductase)/FAD synthetase
MKNDLQRARRVRLGGPADRPDDIVVVPVSGGKDSQLVLARAVDAFGDRVIAVHNYTGYDHSLTYEHMYYMEGRYGVRIEHTRSKKYADMRDLMDQKNMIPGRVARFCTDELKIQAFNHWLLEWSPADRARMVVLMGMRAQESAQRQERYSGLTPDDEFSLRDLNPHKVFASVAMVRVRLPIVDVSTPDVLAELRGRGDRVNPLYARGHSRVGCYPCILAGVGEYRRAAQDPEGRARIIELAAFKAMLVEGKGIRDESVLIEHDLDRILYLADDDPLGLQGGADDEAGGCQWCAI